MKKIKYVVLSIFIFLVYLIPSFIYPSDKTFYNIILKPDYAPPAILYALIWPILYGIFSIYITLKIYHKHLSKELLLYFFINYIVGFFFTKAFFIEHNLFLSFTISFCSFISGLFLFLTSFKESKKEFLFFIPYLLWTGFATILITHIYLLN